MGLIFPFYALLFVKEWKSDLMFMIFCAGCVLAGIAVGAMAYFICYWTILRLIRDLRRKQDEISGGSARLSLPLEYSAPDELGNLIGGYRRFVEKIRDVVLDVKKAAAQTLNESRALAKFTSALSDNAQGQASSIEEITAAFEEITAGLETMSESSRLQAEKIDALFKNMRGVTELSGEVEKRVDETLRLTTEMHENSVAGDASLKALGQGIEKVSKSSREMTHITAIINDISDKINLLSLNASIEAARAGEYGRGFSVVANEISDLAEKTASSVKEIDALIKENNSEIHNSIVTAREATILLSKMGEGVKDVSGSMDFLYRNVTNSIGLSRKAEEDAALALAYSEEMERSTRESDQSFQEILKSIEEINMHTQTIAMSAEDLAARSRVLETEALALDGRVSELGE